MELRSPFELSIEINSQICARLFVLPKKMRGCRQKGSRSCEARVFHQSAVINEDSGIEMVRKLYPNFEFKILRNTYFPFELRSIY